MFRSITFAILILCTGSVTLADVTLNPLFSENMVLQRDQAIPVFGSAVAGEKIAVTLAGETVTTTAGDDGQWQVKLAAQEAGGPHVLSVQGTNRIDVKNVLIGEVWLCSGQSNMAWTVSRARNPEDEAAAADLPQIRHYKTGRGGNGTWTVCSPDTVGGFTATGYFFGRELHKEWQVPVGLINSSVGGTPIEHWTNVADQQQMFDKDEVKQRLATAGTRAAPGSGVLYEGMIKPLAPYAIRGAIWYQGERNSKTGDPYLYRYQMPTLISNWRRDWNQGDFPFGIVQLPDFQAPQQQPSEQNGWVLVREGMARTAATFPNTGMAVTLGLGEAKNIHPRNKQDVGKRLARWALGTVYGREIVYSGPVYQSMSVQGNKIVLSFDHIGGGLTSRGSDELIGFAIAGDDKKFVWADARIVGDKVEVSSPDVSEPVAVRYAWASNPKFSLYNKEGLPASPFRTDEW